MKNEAKTQSQVNPNDVKGKVLFSSTFKKKENYNVRSYYSLGRVSEIVPGSNLNNYFIILEMSSKDPSRIHIDSLKANFFDSELACINATIERWNRMHMGSKRTPSEVYAKRIEELTKTE